MANKDINLNTTKEQERSELHRAIWQIANDLRGSVDGWDFKQYVLGILFYRFISEILPIISMPTNAVRVKKILTTLRFQTKKPSSVEPILSKKKVFIFYRASFL